MKELRSSIDAVVVVSFGGPERREDVMPFLENVLRGKNVPRARLLEVAEHYHLFEGCSPIAASTRALIAGLQQELNTHGPQLPVYGGNRNWHPFLAATVRQMAADGVHHALALVTSAFGSYSGCRQYLEDIARARAEVGAAAPRIDKIRLFYNHPGFVAIMAERVRAARAEMPQAAVLFTAHSIPAAMAAASPYERQLGEACSLVAVSAGVAGWSLAYQSRSGPPHQPWLEPSVESALDGLKRAGHPGVVLVPIGFLSDHMEVVYDLDIEARRHCEAIELPMIRVKTASDHPGFAAMLRELVLERLDPVQARRAEGSLGPWPDTCAPACCLAR